MFRPLLAAILVASLLFALPPAGALQDAAGHGYAYQGVQVEQGAVAYAPVQLWNNGTANETANFTFTSGPAWASGSAPAPIFLLRGWTNTTAIRVAPPEDAPVGDWTLSYTLVWSNGSQQPFGVPVTVIPANRGIDFHPAADFVKWTRDGPPASVTMNVSNAGDETVSAYFAYELFGAAGQPRLANSTPERLIPPRQNTSWTFDLDWGGQEPDRTSQDQRSVSMVLYLTNPTSTHAPIERSFVFFVAEGVDLAIDPVSASIAQGQVASYNATVRSSLDVAQVLHFDVNATNAYAGDAPRLQIDNMILTLGPREAKVVPFSMSTSNATTPASYAIAATLTNDSTGQFVARAYTTLNVHPGAEAVALDIAPRTQTIRQGQIAAYRAVIEEKGGRATTYHLDVNVTSPVTANMPRLQVQNMMVSLAPYERRELDFSMTTVNETPTGDYLVHAALRSDATGMGRNESFFTLTVVTDPGRDPGSYTNLTTAVDPESQHAAKGDDAVYTVALAERAGRATSVSIDARFDETEPMPVASYDGSTILIDAYATANVTIRVSTQNATLGSHTLRITIFADSDPAHPAVGIPYSSANATLVVDAPRVVAASAHVEANLENDSLVADASAGAELRVHAWRNGTDAARVRAVVNASADVFASPLPSGSTLVDANGTTTFSLPLKLGPLAGLAGRHSVLVYVFAEGDDAPWVVLRANVTVDPNVPLLVIAEPTAAARGERANFTIHATNGGQRTIDVALVLPANVSASVAHVFLSPGMTADVAASFAIPADAEIGSRVTKVVLFRYDDAEANVTLDATVSPVAIPPVSNPAPPELLPDLGTPLKTAVDVVAAHPGAAVSLGVAAAAVVALPLARRETWRYVAMAATLPLYTRLAKPDLLADARRGEIHALIAAKPGIPLTELSRAANVSTGALVHHLRMLERHGFLTSRKDGKLRRFYVSGAAPATLVASPTAMQEQILGLLAARPMTRPEIGAALGLTQQGVSYHVKNLERAGRVIVRRDGREARVHRVYDVVVVTPRAKP